MKTIEIKIPDGFKVKETIKNTNCMNNPNITIALEEDFQVNIFNDIFLPTIGFYISPFYSEKVEPNTSYGFPNYNRY